MVENQSAEKLSILVLYCDRSLQTNYVREHLESFQRFLPHHVHYAAASWERPVRFDMDLYDAVFIHFCVRLAHGTHLSAEFAQSLKSFSGLKVLFIQDEYDSPQVACRWIKELGISVVFTCVPEPHREVFYPRAAVGDVQFVHNLTGYVPSRLEQLSSFRPMPERPVFLGYRGRELPFRYGALGREKLTIGVRMKEICQQHGIPHDIAWTENARLDGDSWFDFLSSCRAMLGTESGANIVDHDGSLARLLDQAVKQNPRLTYEEAFARYLEHREGEVRMNQIPPKAFEAIALRTALVLFEGEYSGVVQPDLHFIPLKKDFSNVDEVFAKVRDVRYLQTLTERAYNDIIRSRRYSYAVFVQKAADVLATRVKGPRQPREWVYAVVGAWTPAPDWSMPLPRYPLTKPVPQDGIPTLEVVTAPQWPEPLLSGPLRACWMAVPVVIRKPISVCLKPTAQAWLDGVKWARAKLRARPAEASAPGAKAKSAAASAGPRRAA